MSKYFLNRSHKVLRLSLNHIDEHCESSWGLNKVLVACA